MSNSDESVLAIIDREIARLKNLDELTYADTRKLETLMKTKQLILDRPRSSIKEQWNDITDKQILATIKNGKKKKNIN